MKKYLLSCLILLIIGCNAPEKKKQTALFPEQLFGQWRNVTMRVTFNTYKNKDSVKVFEVTEKDWDAKMGIRPIRTYFWADGTYNSMHLNFNDSVFYNPSGNWKLDGDSLFMRDTFPEAGLSYKYKVTIKGDIAEFWGVEDSDNDGKKDDEFFGTQRKIRDH